MDDAQSALDILMQKDHSLSVETNNFTEHESSLLEVEATQEEQKICQPSDIIPMNASSPEKINKTSLEDHPSIKINDNSEQIPFDLPARATQEQEICHPSDIILMNASLPEKLNETSLENHPTIKEINNNSEPIPFDLPARATQEQEICHPSDIILMNASLPETLNETSLEDHPTIKEINNNSEQRPFDLPARAMQEELGTLPYFDIVEIEVSSSEKLIAGVLEENRQYSDISVDNGNAELSANIMATTESHNFCGMHDVEDTQELHLTEHERQILKHIGCDLYDSLDKKISSDDESATSEYRGPEVLRTDGSLSNDNHQLSRLGNYRTTRRNTAFHQAESDDGESIDDSSDEYIPDSNSETSDVEEPFTELSKSQASNNSLQHSKDSNTLNLSIPPMTVAPNDDELTFQPVSCRQKHVCYYCRKSVFKMARHLESVHKNEDKVKKFLNLPKKNALRKREIEELRKRGNYQNNCNAACNNGNLNVCRRPNKGKMRSVKDYSPCPLCKGYFMKSNIRHHFTRCTGRRYSTKANDKTIQNRGILAMARKINGKYHAAASNIVKNSILPYVKEDEVGTLVRHDEFIILYANNLADRFTSQDEHAMIRQKLRTMGRFLVTLKANNPDVTDFASIYNPQFYQDCLKAAKDMAGYDEYTGNFQAPSTATTIGTSLKQIGMFLEALYIERRDDNKKKMTKDFVKLINQGFQIINRRAAETQTKNSRQKKITLPSMDDIQKLNSFLEQKRKEAFDQLTQEFSHKAWNSLAKTTLVLVQVFNRRRQGEISKISIEDYRSYQRLDESTNKDLFKTLSDECKRIARKYVRFEVRGKRGRTVPVLLNIELVASIDLLLKFRKQANVNSKNPYVFGIPSIDVHRYKRLIACDLMRQYSKECGADIPSTLRGTTLRKQVATMCSNLRLSDEEISDLANYVGHAEKIHKQYYRQPIMTREILGMSKLLETVQGTSKPGHNNGHSVNAIEDVDSLDESNAFEIDDPPPPPSFSSSLQDDTEQDLSDYNNELPYKAINSKTNPSIARKRKLDADNFDTSSEEDTPNSNQRKKGPKKVKVCDTSKGISRIKRIRWTNDEKNIVLDAFKSNVRDSSLPKLIEAEALIKANQKILGRRTAEQVKAWVNNHINTLYKDGIEN